METERNFYARNQNRPSAQKTGRKCRSGTGPVQGNGRPERISCRQGKGTGKLLRTRRIGGRVRKTERTVKPGTANRLSFERGKTAPDRPGVSAGKPALSHRKPAQKQPFRRYAPSIPPWKPLLRSLLFCRSVFRPACKAGLCGKRPFCHVYPGKRLAGAGYFLSAFAFCLSKTRLSGVLLPGAIFPDA